MFVIQGDSHNVPITFCADSTTKNSEKVNVNICSEVFVIELSAIFYLFFTKYLIFLNLKKVLNSNNVYLFGV